MLGVPCVSFACQPLKISFVARFVPFGACTCFVAGFLALACFGAVWCRYRWVYKSFNLMIFSLSPEEISTS